MKIEMDKQYRTRDGRPVRMLCTDRKHPDYPVMALLALDNRDLESYNTYTSEGCSNLDGTKSHNDLVEVSPFDDFELDEPVMVRNSNSECWTYSHFAGVSKSGHARVFGYGHTSWTKDHQCPTICWRYCRRPTEEELSKRCVIEE